MFEFAASMFIIGVGVVFAATVILTRPTTLSVEQKHGPIEKGTACPHCSAADGVHVREIVGNGEVSMPKVIAGALTGGLAFLAVGFHRRVRAVQRHGSACEWTWVG